MGSPSLIPEISAFTIFVEPIGLEADHAYAYLCFEVKDGCTMNLYAKKDSGLVKYQYTQESVNVYCCGIYNGMQEFDLFPPLHEVTQKLSISLHKAGTNAFPHTNLVMHPNLVIQNSLYDDEFIHTSRTHL